MIIGVPKEIKDHETRVGLTPGAARELCEQNHKVYVEAKAGEKGGYSDEAYLQAGAEILYSKKELYEKSDFITKVKELLPEEFEYLREGDVYKRQRRPDHLALTVSLRLCHYHQDRFLHY